MTTFLDLPTEMRLMIYDLVWEDTTVVPRAQNEHHSDFVENLKWTYTFSPGPSSQDRFGSLAGGICDVICSLFGYGYTVLETNDVQRTRSRLEGLLCHKCGIGGLMSLMCSACWETEHLDAGLLYASRQLRAESVFVFYTKHCPRFERGIQLIRFTHNVQRHGHGHMVRWLELCMESQQMWSWAEHLRPACLTDIFPRLEKLTMDYGWLESSPKIYVKYGKMDKSAPTTLCVITNMVSRKLRCFPMLTTRGTTRGISLRIVAKGLHAKESERLVQDAIVSGVELKKEEIVQAVQEADESARRLEILHKTLIEQQSNLQMERDLALLEQELETNSWSEIDSEFAT